MNYIVSSSRTQIYNPNMNRSIIYSSGGQRKDSRLLMLLAWEINFINRKVELKKNKATLIYIGENMKRELSENNTIVEEYGRNIKILAELYPFITFHVFDFPEINYVEIEARNVTVHGRMINDEDIEHFKEDENLYVISNYTSLEIRNDPILNSEYYFRTNNLKDNEENRAKFNEYKFKQNKEFFELKEKNNIPDMVENKEIIHKLSPVSSMLKFRINHTNTYGNDEFEYYNGILLLPIFSGAKSLETRLIVDNYEETAIWNFGILRSNLNHWNDKDRELLALNPFTGTPVGLSHNLGNQMEICVLFAILRDYFISMDVTVSDEDVYSLYSDLFI